MKINIQEWEQTLRDLQDTVKARWPGVQTSIGYTGHILHIQTDSCSGALSLNIDKETLKHLKAEVRVSSGRALNGTLSEMEVGISEYRAVVDILHFLAVKTSSLQILPDIKDKE